MNFQRITRTGGREASAKRIMGNVALAVNRPDVPAPAGWKWVPLTSIARMESGHTPSRKHPEYWDGDIPWLGIRDAKAAHGGTITETAESTNALGISRTASVGYVVKMGRDMATSQDFANWVCSELLDPDFLRYLLIAESSAFSRFSSGSIHQTIYYPELKAFYVCVPLLREQKRIVAVLDHAFAALDRARALAEGNLADARFLKDTAIEYELSLQGLGDLEPLGPHVSVLPGFAFRSGGYSEAPSDIRLIRGDNIVQGGFRWDGVKRWPMSDRSTFRRFELARDDVLIAMDRTWVSAGIKYAVVDESALPSLLVQRVARLRAKATILPRYLAYLIGSKIFERYVLSIHTGLGVPHISGGQIEAFEARMPSPESQESIVNKLDAICTCVEELISTYERAVDDIDDLRHSLLQRAFSGQLT